MEYGGINRKSELRFEVLQAEIYQRFRAAKIEPPTTKQVGRLIRSAINQYETNFCNQILAKLSTETVNEIDIILSTSIEENQINSSDSSKLKTSDFAFLKTDPGPVGLETFLTEIEKLKRIRIIDLPPDLFEGISPKLIKNYRNPRCNRNTLSFTTTSTSYSLYSNGSLLCGTHSRNY